MTKQEFIAVLRKCLSDLPDNERDERLSFYSEMIDDRMEEGLTEEEAVNAIGNIEEIISEPQPEKKPVKRKLKVWELVLLILGFPVWGSLVIAAVAVVISLYASLYALLISLWAVALSCALFVPLAIILGMIQFINGNNAQGLLFIAEAFVSAGLTIFVFIGCKAATSGTAALTKKGWHWIKNHLSKKEDAV